MNPLARDAWSAYCDEHKLDRNSQAAADIEHFLQWCERSREFTLVKGKPYVLHQGVAR